MAYLGDMGVFVVKKQSTSSATNPTMASTMSREGARLIAPSRYPPACLAVLMMGKDRIRTNHITS
jgi:hypothetical protein